MSKSFTSRLPLLACAIALATACADRALAPAASEPTIASLDVQQAGVTADINGDWTFHEDATFLFFQVAGNATKAFRCSSDGTYTFAQTGDTFTGSFDQIGVCTAADGTSFPNNFTDSPVTDGTIQGRNLRFAADGCPYEGAVRGPTLSEMGGAGRCGGGGTFGTYRASWSATR
jgi:hypothetical protein